MNNSYRAVCMTLLLFGSNLLTAVPVQAQATTSDVAAIALAKGPNRLQNLIDGAKKEGSLTVNGPMPTRDLKAFG